MELDYENEITKLKKNLSKKENDSNKVLQSLKDPSNSNYLLI